MANIDLYTPRHLMGVVQNVPPVHTFFRDTFFAHRDYSPTDSVDIDFVKGTRHMAAFVNPRMGGETMLNTGFETKTYKPPLVNPDTVTTADDLMTRMAGEQIYSATTPAERAIAKLAADYKRIEDSIARREEWMCCKAITSGSIQVVGRGVNETISFGFTNTETLATAKKWSASGTDPIADLRRWKLKVAKNGFANADCCIMGADAYAAFIANEKVLKALDTKNYQVGIIAPALTADTGAMYVGHLNDPQIDIYVYNEVYLDDWTDPTTPAVYDLIPAGAVVLLPHSPNFTMAYAQLTAIDESTGAFYTVLGARLLKSYIAHKPDRRILEAMAKPLPIPTKVDSWFVGTVV